MENGRWRMPRRRCRKGRCCLLRGEPATSAAFKKLQPRGIMALQPPIKIIKPAPAPTAVLFTGKSGRLSAFEASLEFFLHPIMPFFRDPDVSEIMVNGCDQIYIEKAGRITLTTAKFNSESDVQAAASNIAQFV